MNTKIVYGGILIAIVIAIGGYAFPKVQEVVSNFGGGTRFPNGISADSTSPVAGQVRGATLTTTGAATFGGNVVITTAANATSTLAVGCVGFYATSSATQLRLSVAPNATTTVNNALAPFVVTAQYGACPI